MIATCIGCGCTDQLACWDDSIDAPCHWLELDRRAGLGVCSICAEHQARFKAGDRAPAYQPETEARP